MSEIQYNRTRQAKLNKSMDVLLPQVRREWTEIDGRMQKVYVPDDTVCRVCQEDVVDGRWNYCSERCRQIANGVQSMFLWDTVRENVLERDDETCQECGLSYEMAQRAYWQMEERAKELTDPLREADTERGVRAYWQVRSRYNPPDFATGFFHVDHIDRIADGGHPLDESNLRVLCKHCHHQKTAEENTRSGSRPADEMTLTEYIES